MRSQSNYKDVSLIKTKVRDKIITSSSSLFIIMSEKQSKSNEYSKKNDSSYVQNISKSGNKGFIKRDKGPAKHHIPYGRHKVDEKLIDQDLLDEAIEEIHEDLSTEQA